MTVNNSTTLRHSVVLDDRDNVRAILASTGYFHAGEIDVAVELVDENLARGEEASGYWFTFAHDANGGECIGFTCHGPIACTFGSFDLFWIAVLESRRGQGIGGILLAEAERQIREAGGRRIYIETSGRPLYAATRHFYIKQGYWLEARLKDFYDVNDDKLVFVRQL